MGLIIIDLSLSKSPLLRLFVAKLCGFCMFLAYVESEIKPRALHF